jgi:hypothetical protein
MVLEAQRGVTRFEDDVEFLGTQLRQVLDRSTESVNGSLRYDLTPLTRLMVSGDVQRERFDFSASRHSTSYSLRPGVEFAPSALIRGTARVGYRKFDIDDAAVPDYSGLSATIDLASTLRGATRLSIRAERDVAYSVSDVQPYYVQTGVFASVVRRITQSWDVNVGVGRQWQDYRAPAVRMPVVPAAVNSLVDLTYQYSYQGGLGYRVAPNILIGVNVEYARRRAGLRGDYNAARAFSNISYEM